MELELYIDEMQWEDNFGDLWNHADNALDKEITIFPMVNNFSDKIKTIKNNLTKKLNKIGKARYLIRGKVKSVDFFENNKDAATHVIDCGININLRPKNFKLKVGDLVEFESIIFGEWTNIFSGCKQLKIKIKKIKKAPREVEYSVYIPSSNSQKKERRIQRDLIINAEVIE